VASDRRRHIGRFATRHTQCPSEDSHFSKEWAFYIAGSSYRGFIFKIDWSLNPL